MYWLFKRILVSYLDVKHIFGCLNCVCKFLLLHLHQFNLKLEYSRWNQFYDQNHCIYLLVFHPRNVFLLKCLYITTNLFVQINIHSKRKSIIYNEKNLNSVLNIKSKMSWAFSPLQMPLSQTKTMDGRYHFTCSVL